MSSTETKVRRFEGTLRVKGFRIAYVVWIPYQNEFNFNESTVYDHSLSIDPLSMTNYFEESIVCFHGWLDNANSYATLAPLMAERFNMRVIGIDLPGHGKSSHSTVGYYSATLYSTTMIRVLHRLGIKSFHLMGHSLSACFLPYLTPVLEHSGKFIIKSLICIEQFGAMRNIANIKAVDISTLLPTYQDEQIQTELQEDDEQNESGIIDNNIKRLPKLYGSVDELVRSRIYVTEQVYPGKQTIDEKSAKLILERNVGKLVVIENETRKKQVKYYLRFDPKLRKSSNTLRNVFVLDMQTMSDKVIRKTKCPMLGVFGDRGWPHLDLVAKNVERLGMPNLEIIRMEGSHHLHADAPKEFLDAITPFLTKAMEKYKKDHPHLNGNGNGNGHSKL